MKKYPHEAREPEMFIPPLFRDNPDFPNPPTFYLRWGTPREKEQYRFVLDQEGCVSYAEQAMREEMIRGFAPVLGEEQAAELEPKVREWWDAADQYAKEIRGVPRDQVQPWKYEGETEILTKLAEVGQNWQPYKNLNAQNNKYDRMQGHAINSVIIERFENLDVRVQRSGRYLSIDTAMEISEELDDLALAKGYSAHRPSRQLSVECLMHLFLDKEREGNSDSPAPSEATPPGSKTGEESTSGTSTELESSTETPANS